MEDPIYWRDEKRTEKVQEINIWVDIEFVQQFRNIVDAKIPVTKHNLLAINKSVIDINSWLEIDMCQITSISLLKERPQSHFTWPSTIDRKVSDSNKYWKENDR